VAPQQRVELLGQLRVSSLACLRRLPVNELKIDKNFVMAMEREEGDAKIVRSTIDLRTTWD
jgi:EAL domain-containing protein (putative c-di-GMP-specific phosphodiesterase class I)